MDRKSAATYPTDNSKPIEDYETICLLAEEETKYNISNTAVNDLNNQINIGADTANSDNHHTKRNEGHESYYWNVSGIVLKQNLNHIY